MSSPEIGASTVRTMYYLSIICARRSIYIANPYFVPDEAAIDTLIEAKQRGVDVRIMVSGIHNDNWLARQNSVRLFGPLLRAGIEILEYNRTMLHHKTMVVDDVWATVGTTNFDNRSFAHNEENNVCFYDRELAGMLRDTFLADLAAAIASISSAGAAAGSGRGSRNSSRRSCRSRPRAHAAIASRGSTTEAQRRGVRARAETITRVATRRAVDAF